MPRLLRRLLPLLAGLIAGAARADSIAWRGWSDDIFDRARREHRFVLLDLLYGLAWTVILVHPASVDVVSKRMVPITGPHNVPMPPTIDTSAASIEMLKLKAVAGSMK